MKHNSLFSSTMGFALILILFLAVSCKKETTFPSCGDCIYTPQVIAVVEITSAEWVFQDNVYSSTFQMQGNISSVSIGNGHYVQPLNNGLINFQFADREFPGTLWVTIDGTKAVVSYSNVYHESPGKLHVWIGVIQ